jgi:hypothetical protein
MFRDIIGDKQKRRDDNWDNRDRQYGHRGDEDEDRQYRHRDEEDEDND